MNGFDMEEREDQFLKKAFGNLEPEVELNKDFNRFVLRDIEARQNAGIQLIHYVRLVAPVLLLTIVSGVFILIFKGNTMAEKVMEYLPLLKPWHIFAAFIILYFHFVRSVLILVFLYFKNWFRNTGNIALNEN